MERIAAVLISYFDESWDQHQKKILVIGGMIGRYEQWSKIEWPWKQLLVKYGLKYYRASEAEFALGEFDKEPFRTGKKRSTPEQYGLLQNVREEFFQVIARGIVSGIAMGIRIPLFYEIANTPEKLEKFGGTPYYLCGHTAMLRLLKAVKYKIKSKELVPFIFDRQDDYRDEMMKIHDHIASKESEFHSQVGSITFADKQGFIPLQVADTLAYEVRKDFERKMANPKAKERPEFTRLKKSGKIFEISLCERKCLKHYLKGDLKV